MSKIKTHEDFAAEGPEALKKEFERLQAENVEYKKHMALPQAPSWAKLTPEQQQRVREKLAEVNRCGIGGFTLEVLAQIEFVQGEQDGQGK